MNIPCLMLVIALQFSSAPKEPNTVGICTVISNANRFDGKIVRVTGTLHADFHSTAIGNEKCDRSAVLNFSSKNESSPWMSFYDGVAKQSASLDTRPFVVTLEGKFRKRVCPQKDFCFSRIAVTRIVEASFENGRNPSTSAHNGSDFKPGTDQRHADVTHPDKNFSLALFTRIGHATRWVFHFHKE
ncbi:MAG TPA: hypothetical protein VJ723_05770 [Candidatus Angelobacter sp.]|nr:hypothetical protein [Candidatus Angelobacter sp.]